MLIVKVLVCLRYVPFQTSRMVAHLQRWADGLGGGVAGARHHAVSIAGQHHQGTEHVDVRRHHVHGHGK